MKLFLVTVRPPTAQASGRYFDSIWVVQEHADERASQLRQEFNRAGFRVWFDQSVLPVEWYVSVTEAVAFDGQLADGKAK